MDEDGGTEGGRDGETEGRRDRRNEKTGGNGGGIGGQKDRGQKGERVCSGKRRSESDWAGEGKG